MQQIGSMSFFNTPTPPLPSEVELEKRILNEYLERNPVFANRLQEFNTHLKRIDFTSTLIAARETLDLTVDFLRRPASWDDPVQLLLALRGLGRRVIAARPLELVVGCMVRRVLFLLREEMAKVVRQMREQALEDRRKVKQPAQKRGQATDDFESNESEDVNEEDEDDEDDEEEAPKTATKSSKSVERQGFKGDSGSIPTLQAILAESEAVDTSYFSLISSSPIHFEADNSIIAGQKSPWKSLKKNMLDAVHELRQELENVHDPIAKQSIEYIHAREVVLVYGLSHAVQAFLINAHKHGLPNFEVFVAETCDGYRGHKMAMELAQNGIDTTVITDSAIFALMARVNKVLIGARAIMANGGVLSESGTNMVATAAKQHSVPLVCVTGLYKLCPLYPFNQDSFNDLVSPGTILPFADVPVGDVEVIAPAFDYVSPDKVSLFVTDAGAHQPSYIYRLLAEFYSPLDKLTEGVPQLDL